MNVGQMLRIAHSVSDKVHTTRPTTNIKSVSQTLKKKEVGALPVLSDGNLVGIISERDIIIKVVAEGFDPQHVLVFDIMTKNPTVVSLNHSLEECRDLMEQGRFRHLPVLDNNKLVGMISVRDILVALVKNETDLRRHYEDYIYANR